MATSQERLTTMSDVKWIKISTQMFEDEKIKLIEQMPEADTLLIIWIKLLSQAGRANDNGYIYLSENIPYTDEMLSTIFNRPLTIVRMALSVFRNFGMIEINDDHFISICNWDKHQNIAGLEKIREQNRLRKQKERERKKLELPSPNSHVTVTPNHGTEEELEVELEEDKEIENNKKTSSRKRVFDEFSDEMKLVEFFIQEIRKNSEGFKTPNKQAWCDEFRKIIDIDHRDKIEVSKLIRWVQSDDFEKANVLSPTKLRKRYDALKIKMLNPPKKRESKEKVPEWFVKKNETVATPPTVDMDIQAERERLKRELGGLNYDR